MDRSPHALTNNARKDSHPSAATERKPRRDRATPTKTARPVAGQTRIWIGTSGWSYDGWRWALYPKKLPKKDWLRYYGAQFCSAEINASFYRTPSEEAVRAWRRDTPRDFLFAWKASKFMTHWKRLLPTCVNSIALMQTRLRLLGPKFGVVLFQLPHRFRKDTGRLRDFFHMLPGRYRYAFEFRDQAWYADDVFALLQRFDVALCISAVAGNGIARLCPRPRTIRALSGKLFRQDVAALGRGGAALASRRARRFCLFRQ
jgi:uncharacterized protein DUF72